jgi:hypothetical protein
MATNPFGSGKRPWARITETLRATATSVLGKGELVVTDGGKAYVPDGTKQLKDLSPLIDAASVAATYETQAHAAQNFVAMAKANIGIDTDGVPYVGANYANAVPVQLDTDGVPYLNA